MGLDRLVVVLPGIGGSVLARSTDLDDVVWDAGKADIAGVAFQPSRLAIDEALTPIGLTESAKFLGYTVVPGYEKLLAVLDGLGAVDRGHPAAPVPGADIVVVPYDFRRSIRMAAERLDEVVTDRLTGLSDEDRSDRVVIVAHSLGGLVARAWMGLIGEPGQERWRWCRALVTLGTPHRGAPKALDWVVNGIAAGPLRLPGSSGLLRGWPSVAELLPRYPAIRDTRVPDPTGDGAALYPHQLMVPGLGKAARDAYDLHLEIERAWSQTMPRQGPEMVACLGWSHPTPDAAYWDGRRLRVVKEQPDWLGLRGWEKDVGDGTVPGASAVPIEQNNDVSSPRRQAERHIRLASADIVRDLILKYASVAPPRKMRDPRGPLHPPSLGLDLDQLQAAGTPIPVSVVFRQVAADLRGQEVWARLTTPDGAVARVALDRLDGRFTGVLPAQRPGLYEVRVTARSVPGAGHLETSDTIAVVDEHTADG